MEVVKYWLAARKKAISECWKEAWQKEHDAVRWAMYATRPGGVWEQEQIHKHLKMKCWCLAHLAAKERLEKRWPLDKYKRETDRLVDRQTVRFVGPVSVHAH